MSHEATPCLVEHAVPRQHGPECPGGDCPGCRVAVADHDRLVCRWHALATRDAVASCPDVVGHLRDHVTPGAATGDDRGGTRDAPAPLSVAAVNAADDLHATLASWALLILEEHPGSLHGPDWSGSDVRPASTRRLEGDYVGRGLLRRYVPGPRQYDPARVAGLAAGRGSGPTRLVATWMLRHLDWALRQPWAGVLADELPAKVDGLRRQWPTSERPQHLPQPCPACQLKAVERRAPSCQGAPVTISCLACGHLIPEEHYGLMTRLVATVARR